MTQNIDNIKTQILLDSGITIPEIVASINNVSKELNNQSIISVELKPSMIDDASITFFKETDVSLSIRIIYFIEKLILNNNLDDHTIDNITNAIIKSANKLAELVVNNNMYPFLDKNTEIVIFNNLHESYMLPRGLSFYILLKNSFISEYNKNK